MVCIYICIGVCATEKVTGIASEGNHELSVVWLYLMSVTDRYDGDGVSYGDDGEQRVG